MKIYFASAIANSTHELRLEDEKLKRLIQEKFHIHEYLGFNPSLNAKTVFLHDKEQIDKSDLIIAECSNPSLGVGYEIGYALSLGKKVIALAKESATVSKMIEGNPKITFFRYQNADDAMVKVLKEAQNHAN